MEQFSRTDNGDMLPPRTAKTKALTAIQENSDRPPHLEARYSRGRGLLAPPHGGRHPTPDT